MEDPAEVEKPPIAILSKPEDCKEAHTLETPPQTSPAEPEPVKVPEERLETKAETPVHPAPDTEHKLESEEEIDDEYVEEEDEEEDNQYADDSFDILEYVGNDELKADSLDTIPRDEMVPSPILEHTEPDKREKSVEPASVSESEGPAHEPQQQITVDSQSFGHSTLYEHDYLKNKMPEQEEDQNSDEIEEAEESKGTLDEVDGSVEEVVEQMPVSSEPNVPVTVEIFKRGM